MLSAVFAEASNTPATGLITNPDKPLAVPFINPITFGYFYISLIGCITTPLIPSLNPSIIVYTPYLIPSPICLGGLSINILLRTKKSSSIANNDTPVDKDPANLLIE